MLLNVIAAGLVKLPEVTAKGFTEEGTLPCLASALRPAAVAGRSVIARKVTPVKTLFQME